MPTSWRLVYKSGDDRLPVERPTKYGVAVHQFNEVTFKPVTTSALRIEVQLKRWTSCPPSQSRHDSRRPASYCSKAPPP